MISDKYLKQAIKQALEVELDLPREQWEKSRRDVRYLLAGQIMFSGFFESMERVYKFNRAFDEILNN